MWYCQSWRGVVSWLFVVLCKKYGFTCKDGSDWSAVKSLNMQIILFMQRSNEFSVFDSETSLNRWDPWHWFRYLVEMRLHAEIVTACKNDVELFRWPTGSVCHGTTICGSYKDFISRRSVWEHSLQDNLLALNYSSWAITTLTAYLADNQMNLGNHETITLACK